MKSKQGKTDKHKQTATINDKQSQQPLQKKAATPLPKLNWTHLYHSQLGGGWVWRRRCASYGTGASNWY